VVEEAKEEDLTSQDLVAAILENDRQKWQKYADRNFRLSDDDLTAFFDLLSEAAMETQQKRARVNVSNYDQKHLFICPLHYNF
jgi:hypothetical protein